MAKAIIKIVNCVGPRLEFPARTDYIEIPDVSSMSIRQASEHATTWCRNNHRTLASAGLEIVYGRDNMPEQY